MLNTPFTKYHEQLGAKMAPFAGYNMPISYEGIVAEHHTVRKNVGVFDVSHMGEFIVRGEEATEFLNYVTTNDVLKLDVGKIQYTCMTNENGGIVDDLLLYKVSPNGYMLVVNASNIEKDWNWLLKHKPENVEMEDISNKVALLAIQGPNAVNVLQPFTNIALTDIQYYTFERGVFADCENVLISATGYTGAGGFEIYFDEKNADKIWQTIFEKSVETGIKPCGLGARDTLRLEMGFCLYGNDLNDTTTPISAGLSWITKFNKNFVAKSILENEKLQGSKRKLVGFEMIERGIPRHDYIVVDANGNEIGIVTSGTQSPTLEKALGMAYINAEWAKPSSEVFIRIRNNDVKAIIVKTPFLKA